MHRKILAATAVAALAAPAAAQAHVTVQPNTAAAGAFTKLDVRVPTERDNASTTKVDLQFPQGFADASYQPVPGWKVKVVKTKLAKPIQTDDGPVTEGIGRMIWTATGSGIGPGQFTDFPLSVQIPGKAGDKLTFKALQTYSNGEVVRWIGGPDAEEPAPQVAVTAAQPEGGAPASSGANTAKSQPADTSDTASKGLGITALILGGLGLLLGSAALVVAGRRRTAAA
jgi:uncharacterized protein YcnI